MSYTANEPVNELPLKKYIVWKCTHSHKPHNPAFRQPCLQWNISKTIYWNHTGGKGFPQWCRFFTHDEPRRRRLSRGDFWVFDTKDEAEAFAYRKGQEDLHNMMNEHRESQDAQEWLS